MQRAGDEQSFGELLRRHRMSAGLTQEQLAERAGLSRRGIADLERGARRAPYVYTVERLATALALPSKDHTALIEAGRHPGISVARLPKVQSGEGRRLRVVSTTAVDPGDTSTASQPKHNLPAELSSFIGREAELAQLTRRLASTRFLTLLGPGGVGKTRLALALAAARASDYADEVVFVDLAPVRDARLVPATIARSLEIREPGGRSARDLLLAHLRGRQQLLVLDNFEHLLSGATFLVDLLHACPRLSVLVTSRTALHVRGEMRFSVLPLATPEVGTRITDQDFIAWPAVRLFVERTQAVSADFALTESTAPVVASICRRLDGLPLAIELAAAQMRLLPPEALLHRLDRRLPVLTRGARDLPQRQQTLRNTLVWSHDLLGPAEQRLFRRLAVFAGGWTLEAAEAVCADGQLLPIEVFSSLQSLVDHSLVRVIAQPPDGPRFAMLETIREYAAEQLEATEAVNELRERHVAWYLAYAEAAEPELRGPGQQGVLTRLDLEGDNMRSVLSWLLVRSPVHTPDSEAGLRLGAALARFWSARGQFAEGRAWLERAMDAAAAIGPLKGPCVEPSAAHAKALLGLGWLVAAQGDFSRALAYDQASLAIYRELGDHSGIAAPLLAMAHLAEYRGQSREAQALLVESIEHARASGDDSQLGEALCWMAMALYRTGELVAARAALEESAGLLRRTNDVARLAGTLYVQGEIEAQQAEHHVAEAALTRSSELYRQAGDRVGEARAMGWLAYVALHVGDHATAWRYLSECVQRGRQAGFNDLSRWLCLLATLERADGLSEAAWAHARESLVLFQRMGCPALDVHVLEVAGGLLAATRGQCNIELAASLLAAAEATREGNGRALPPAERPDYARDVASVRSQLPDEVMIRAWGHGQSMTLVDATAAALARSGL